MQSRTIAALICLQDFLKVSVTFSDLSWFCVHQIASVFSFLAIGKAGTSNPPSVRFQCKRELKTRRRKVELISPTRPLRLKQEKAASSDKKKEKQDIKIENKFLHLAICRFY
ncbi:hypothetical protein [Roseibium alexandrii]|uniref:hypothetical protein n=1 Tax=Roseibium alexandrii TaxID=388408 RepID=UPI001072EC99|nr:hypothetical protein [Roseibium alexandrii]